MTAIAPSAAAARNGAIDTLRGLAILLVVLHHIGLRIPLSETVLGGALPGWLLDGLNYNGYESVFAFFVISGFLITGNSLRRWPVLARMDVRAFYARRVARIAPTFLVLLAVLSAFHLLGLPDYVIERPGQSLPAALGAALGLCLNWYEGVTGYLPGNWDVLWSLSIEESFYLLFPIACLLARRNGVLVVLLTLFALSLPFTHHALAHNEIWQEKAYLPGMAAVATGIVTALAVDGRRLSAGVARLCRGIGTVGLLVIGFAQAWLWKGLADGTLLVLTASVALLLVASGPCADAWPARFDGALAPIRAWGRLSYEIYLSHMFVVYALVRVAREAPQGTTSGLWVYAVALPACFALGLAVDKLLSAPARRALLRRSDAGRAGD